MTSPLLLRYPRVAIGIMLAMVLLAAVADARAQSPGSALVGVVRDASTHQPLADVIVTAACPPQSGEHVVVTDSTGLFRIPEVVACVYAVRFEKEGFKPFERSGIAVHAGATMRINAELLPTVIQAQQVVVVARPTVDVGSSSTTTTFASHVPVAPPARRGAANRSFESVAEVAPRSRGAIAMAAPKTPAAWARPSPPASRADVPHSAEMLVYTAGFSMAVYKVPDSMDVVERIGRDLGGYLGTRADDVITIRVPRDRFDDAVERVAALGDVLHRDIKAEDVTDQYVDMDARLKNARAMRDRLLDLLARASVAEALSIERELGRVTEEIELMEGKLKALRDRIAFSTITVQFGAIARPAAEPVHDTSLLAPFPWLRELGLQPLLDLPQ